MRNLRRSFELALARRSLARFATMMVPAYELTAAHKLMIQNLEDLLAGRIQKLALLLPPRHGKSKLGSELLPAYALGRDPSESIIAVSYGSDLAETFGRRVRNLIADPAFRDIFPACQLSPDSQAVYRFETVSGGEYSATGRGGPITGRGASLLILDDLIKDWAEANSEATTRGAIEWLQSVALTRLVPRGRILALSTRWSARDPVGWLIVQPGWVVLQLAAVSEDADKDPLGRKRGEALWPNRYSIEELGRIKADVGSRVFQCLYQGNVAAAQGTIFKRDWFRRYQQAPEKFSRIIQSWDTSFKTGQTNDYSVCVTIGQAENGFYLLNLYRDRLEFPDLKRKVSELADLWRPQEILIEDAASGQSLIQELKLSTSWPVIPIKADRDKESRAQACTGYFEAGRVLFPEAPWVADLEDELAGFPSGAFDDQTDALCQAINRWRDDASHGLGLLDWVNKNLAAFGEELEKWAGSRERAAQAAAVSTAPEKQTATWQPVKDEPALCEACGIKAVVQHPGRKRGETLCNQCHAVNGVPPAGRDEKRHVHVWRNTGMGFEQCDDCQEQRWITGLAPITTNGCSFRQLESLRQHRRFGRFG